MDSLLKCYFENFTSLPRTTLHDRRKRREAVEYISTLIEGCSRGENCDSQKTVREAIVAIIRYHEEKRQENGSVCLMGKYHNVLYVAVKLCFDWQLKDTGTVATLLEHIHSCERTFERIFIGALFGSKAPHYVAGWKSDFDNQEENFRAVIYFLDHATNASLEFRKDDDVVRFIDVPIECCGNSTPLKIALVLGLPDKTLTFLRYGAQICCHQEIEHVLKRLMDFKHSYPYNIVNCLQIVLRVVPTIKLPLEREFGTIKEKLFGNFQELIQDAIIPPTRCGVQVPELKHLSRCSIRRRLWENHQLPDGIRLLLIPETLQCYVDLMQD